MHCFPSFFPIVCNCLFYFCYLKSSLFQKYSKLFIYIAVLVIYSFLQCL